MNKIIGHTLFLCLFSMVSFAQIQTVHFQIQDPSKENLAGMTISVLDMESDEPIVQGISDIDGKISFHQISYPFKIKVTGIGYKPFSKTYHLPSSSTSFLIQLETLSNALNEIIVTGVGRPTKLDEAVSIYKIINASEVKAQGAVNLQDALKNQLGISIGQDAMIGGTIKMQGMSGDNVKILVDGMPVNGREGQNIDLSTLNLSNIEKIEIAQGPMGVMYGADAIGGVINLITKTNTNTWKTGVTTHYESIGKYNADVTLARQIDKNNIYLNLGRNFFEGWDPEDNTKRDPLWRPKEQYFANLKYIYRFSNETSISFASDYFNDLVTIKGGTENYSFYNRNVRDEFYKTQRWMNRLQAKWRSGKNGYWESNNSFSYYNRKRNSYFTDLSTLEKKLSQFEGDQSNATFNNATLRTTYHNKVGKLSYTFGYDFNLEFSNSAEKLKEGEKQIGDYAALLIAEYEISSKVKLQPALRAAYNTQYKVPLIPSFSILYKPNSDYQVRASYARGFRAPTLKEMYLDFKDSNHDLYGNSDLKAEDGHHLQFSTGYNLYQKKNNYNNLTLSVFYNNVHNQISLAQTAAAVQPGTPSPYTYVNIGHFRNLNFQLSSQNQYEQFYVSLAGSYNKNLKTNTYTAFDYWEGSANFHYKFSEQNAGISLFYKYTGKAPLILTDITGGVVIDDGIKTNAYHNLDASIEKSFFNNKLQVIIGMRNLFNNTIIGNSGVANSEIAVIPGHSGASSGGLNISTGRSFFTTISMQLFNK